MCLIVNKTWKSLKTAKKSSIPVAKEDIKVYKLLQKRTNLSPYQMAKYEKGKLHESPIIRYIRVSLFPHGCYYKVEQGLHAYRTIEKAKSRFSYQERYCKVVEMIIPKGSKYYIGTNDDIVSNKLYWPKD